jgi:ATP-dependent DNA helicase RecQ
MGVGAGVAEQSVVVQLTEVAAGSGTQGSAASRLATALESAALTDAQPLVRQVLSQLAHEIPGTWLDLGTDLGGADWNRDGLLTRLGPSGHVQVTLGAPWKPRWPLAGDLSALRLAASAPARPSEASPIGTLAREFVRVPLDPFLRGIPGIENYRGVAQREAVLAAIRCPPGGVLHVLLPTGTGKSLVGLARGLTDRLGTTIVVVPTVALAIDQERKALGSPMADAMDLPDRLAYIGDLPNSYKQGILDRVAAGTQRLLFTSPEALINGRLASRVHELAARGGLSALVIDEAHLVATWGESFRPVFQVLPALRNGLIDAALAAGHRPLATITMSGTLTSVGLATLQRLFAGQPTAVVGGAWLRPEPRFLNAQFASTDERDAAVIEALSHLPRPAIVYVSLRERTEELAGKIRAAGFSRVAAFHGDTNPADRRAVLEGWSGAGTDPARYDVVVGNSAFGLGIDVPNVRTIVHACVPETFDRLYQEVGRGGRDGHSSVSLLMMAPGDVAEAAGLRAPKPITPEVAWPRLVAMFQGSELVDGSWHTVNVTRRVDGGLPTESDVRWNVHILATMLQAELLDLRTRPLPRCEESEKAVDDGGSQNTIRPHRGIPLGQVSVQFEVRWRGIVIANEEDWAREVSGYRTATREAADHSGKAVVEVAKGLRCAAAAAREQYRLKSDEGGQLIDWSPIGVCSGCASCGARPHRGPSVAAGFSEEVDSFLEAVPRFRASAGPGPVDLLVRCTTPREIRQTIQRLVELGFPLVVGENLPLDDDAWRATLRAAPLGWVITDGERSRTGMPTIVVLSDRFDSTLLRPDPAGVVFIANERATGSGHKFPLTQLRAWIAPSRVLEEVLPCPS